MTITMNRRSSRWRLATLTAACLLALLLSARGLFGGFRAAQVPPTETLRSV